MIYKIRFYTDFHINFKKKKLVDNYSKIKKKKKKNYKIKKPILCKVKKEVSIIQYV